MKFLILLVVVMAVLWLLRGRSSSTKPPPPQPRAAPQKPQEMVACAQCGLNLPRSEAVVGARGLYCSAAHLQARGDST